VTSKAKGFIGVSPGVDRPVGFGDQQTCNRISSRPEAMQTTRVLGRSCGPCSVSLLRSHGTPAARHANVKRYRPWNAGPSVCRVATGCWVLHGRPDSALPAGCYMGDLTLPSPASPAPPSPLGRCEPRRRPAPSSPMAWPASPASPTSAAPTSRPSSVDAQTQGPADVSQWVNTVLGNLKTSFSGAYHSFDFGTYAERYLARSPIALTAASISRRCRPACWWRR
jgi:hypothetical protein